MTTGAKDGKSLRVLPIMYDVLQQVDIAPGRDLFEEAARNGVRTICNSGMCEA